MYDRKELQRQEYVRRINQVLDYVSTNLAGDLSLERLAKEAGFSRYHFHRVFKLMVGETLSEYIRRVRVEEAANRLAALPDASITEIALDTGYSSSATFARAFKERFGMSASEYRDKKLEAQRARDGEALPPVLGPGDMVRLEADPTKGDDDVAMELRVERVEPFTVAYVRNFGSFMKMGEAFEKLSRWAAPRGLFGGPDVRMLGVYHDNPFVTDPEKLRADACLTVPPGTETSGVVGLMDVPGGLYAMGRVEILMTQYGAAWTKLVDGWLPRSGYVVDERPCFEQYHSGPGERPGGRILVDICEPIRPR